MFGLFKRGGKRQEPHEELNSDEAVIIDVLFSDNGEAPGQKLQRIYDLEDAIEQLLPEASDIDGHELSEEDATVYIYGKSADAIWKSTEDTVREQTFERIRVTLRYGAVDDPEAREKVISVK